MIAAPGLPLDMPTPTEVDPGALLARAEADKLAGLEARVQAGRELRPGELKLLRDLQAQRAGKQIVRNLEELAAALGVSSRTCKRWLPVGMPVTVTGSYDVDAVRAWARAAGRKVVEDPDVLGSGRAIAAPESNRNQTELTWKEEKTKQDALLAKTRRLEKEGKLVDRGQVARLFADRVSEVQRGLLSLERVLPPRVHGLETEREIAAVVRTTVRALLESYARELPATLAGEVDE